MAEVEPSIHVQWEETFLRQRGFSNLVSPPYAEQKATFRSDALIEDIADLSKGKLFNELRQAESLPKVGPIRVAAVTAFIRTAGSVLRAIPSLRIDKEVPRTYNYKYDQYGNLVTTSSVLLLGNAIRHAKAQPENQVTLSGQEWAELTFEHAHLNPNREVSPIMGDRPYFEAVTGIKDPGVQRKILGSVALAIIDSDLLTVPQQVHIYGEVGTLQTSH